MNTLKTTVLMALLMGIMIAVGGAFGGRGGAMLMLIISLGFNFVTYWFSDSIVLKMYDAREVDRNSAPELYGLVERLAANAELPMPRVYIVNSGAPNAFATGRNPSHAAVAVTTGLMSTLDYEEIGGVLAHELSHVKHRDTLISCVAAAMAGVISTIANIAQWAAIFGVGRSDDDDVVLRLGGDEFAVFLPGMLDKERATAFFDRLFSNIEHIDIAEMGGKHILLSLGACFYNGMDRITFDQLYRRADTAMYDSKKKQGYSATIFDEKQ